MNIVWFSWKDIKHPHAGGAETVSFQIMKRLVANGHSVKLLTASYPDAPRFEIIEGIEINRKGGRFSVYWHAFRYFRKNFKSWPDLVIDEMNTIPFGCAFYTKKRTILLTYQLARKVWFYQMIFPLSLVGYLHEPLYLRLLALRYKTILTESESTKKDLTKYGFSSDKIHIFRVGIGESLLQSPPYKPSNKQILFLGALRPMKRPLDSIKAFEIARDQQPNLTMAIAGSTSGKYAHSVIKYVRDSRHASAIQILGRVSNEDKSKLLEESQIILVTSVKEGWGLIVTEANNHGTPAIVYDADGLRDSVLNGKTGLVVSSGQFTEMGNMLVKLLNDKATLVRLGQNAFKHSKQFTFNNSYEDFIKSAEIHKAN